MNKRASKYSAADMARAVEAYGRLKSIGKAAAEIGIPFASTQRLLYESGTPMQKVGDAHRGRPWTEARRAHSAAAKPRGELTGPQTQSLRALGNRTVSSQGYIVVRIGPMQRQYEHVLVAERALKRKLRKGEVVHHINCIRSENTGTNLLICDRAYHKALHARMRKHPYWRAVEEAAKPNYTKE